MVKSRKDFPCGHSELRRSATRTPLPSCGLQSSLSGRRFKAPTFPFFPPHLLRGKQKERFIDRYSPTGFRVGDRSVRQKADQTVPDPEACLSDATGITAMFGLDLSGGCATMNIALLYTFRIRGEWFRPRKGPAKSFRGFLLIPEHWVVTLVGTPKTRLVMTRVYGHHIHAW
jgi:hypothetical protein